MIVTIYSPNGTKKRVPIGYSGGQCHAATAPYEKREFGPSVTKTPTPAAYDDPVPTTTEVAQQAKVS